MMVLCPLTSLFSFLSLNCHLFALSIFHFLLTSLFLAPATRIAGFPSAHNTWPWWDMSLPRSWGDLVLGRRHGTSKVQVIFYFRLLIVKMNGKSHFCSSFPLFKALDGQSQPVWPLCHASPRAIIGRSLEKSHKSMWLMQVLPSVANSWHLMACASLWAGPKWRRPMRE